MRQLIREPIPPRSPARVTPNFSRPGRVRYEQPLNMPYPGEERMTLRERALNRHQYPLNEQSLRELRDLHFQQGVMQHLQEIRSEVRATHENTRESLTRLELLRDQVEEVGSRIRREMNQIARISRCNPTDIRTWHHCVKLYYQLLYTLFVLMIHTLHVICGEMRSFGHAVIWPFSVVVILGVWLGEMLIAIAISDGAVVGASFGRARFTHVFRPVFHGVYLLSYAILSVAYNTFRPYYTSVLSEMSEIIQEDINITAGRLALQQSGMNALALARNRTEQKVREIVVQEVGGLLNQTAEVPSMVYNATVNATMAAGAAVAGAGIAAASTIGEALGTVGTKMGDVYSSASTGVTEVVVPAAKGAFKQIGTKIGEAGSTLYDFTGKSTAKALPVSPKKENLNISTTKTKTLESASQAASYAKETAAAAASAAVDSAAAFYDALPSKNALKEKGKLAGEAAAAAGAAAKQRATEAAEAMKSFWKGKTAKIEGGSKHRKSKRTGNKSRGKSKARTHRKQFSILKREEQKVFDQTRLGQSVIEMRDMINQAKYVIPMNEEMYHNMYIVLQVVDNIIPFLLQGLDKSIDVCKLIHKHKIDIREHNDALIDGLVRI